MTPAQRHAVGVAALYTMASAVWMPSARSSAGFSVSERISLQAVPVAQINGADRLRKDSQDNLYAVSSRDHSIGVYSPSLQFTGRIGQIGTGPGELMHPADVAISREGVVWVADTGNDRVQAFAPSGKHLGEFRVRRPVGLALLASDTIAVVSIYDHEAIRVYSSDGIQVGTLGHVDRSGSASLKLAAFLSRSKIDVGRHGDLFYLPLGLLEPRLTMLDQEGRVIRVWRPEGVELRETIGRAARELARREKNNRLGMEYTVNAFAVNPDRDSVWIAPAAPVIYEYSFADPRAKKAEYELKAPRPFGNIGARDLLWSDTLQSLLLLTVGYCFKVEPPTKLQVTGGSV